MTTFGGTYSTGTVDVENGSPVVVGNGVIWSDVLEGDEIWVAGAIALVDSVNATMDEITLKHDWAGPSLSAATYVILRRSWLRFGASITQNRIRSLLSEYPGAVQGTWVPVVTGETINPAVVYSGQIGAYYRVRNLVIFDITVWATLTGGSGALLISLPFAVANLTDYYPVFPATLRNINTHGRTSFNAFAQLGESNVRCVANQNDGAGYYVLVTDCNLGGAVIAISGSYITDDP